MTYLVGSRSSGTPPSIPSRLQEHFQPRAQGHRQPPRQQVRHLLPGVPADPVSPGAQTAATGLQAAPSSPAHAVLRARRLCAGAASQCAGISLPWSGQVFPRISGNTWVFPRPSNAACQAGVVKLLHGSARVRSEEEGPFQRLEPKPR